MMKMVRKHLSQKYVVQEEDLLERIAESSEKGECTQRGGGGDTIRLPARYFKCTVEPLNKDFAQRITYI
jgi:hypothetical protein